MADNNGQAPQKVPAPISDEAMGVSYGVTRKAVSIGGVAAAANADLQRTKPRAGPVPKSARRYIAGRKAK